VDRNWALVLRVAAAAVWTAVADADEDEDEEEEEEVGGALYSAWSSHGSGGEGVDKDACEMDAIEDEVV